MVSYMDNVVDTLASQVLRGKLDELAHSVWHKLYFPLCAYKENEATKSLPRKKRTGVRLVCGSGSGGSDGGGGGLNVILHIPPKNNNVILCISTWGEKIW